jgi:hypothetical protein
VHIGSTDMVGARSFIHDQKVSFELGNKHIMSLRNGFFTEFPCVQ